MAIIRNLQLRIARGKLRERRADFYYDIASTLEDKVPLFTTLRKYEARARRRDPSAALLYQDMLRAMQSGSLSQALRGIVPANELIMIDAIQGSGDKALSDGLYFLSETVEKVDRIRRTVQKAVVYPTILFILFSGMLTGFSVFAVPILADLLPVEKWPMLGQILYGISYVIRNFGIFILGTIVLGIVSFIYALPRWSGRLRCRADRYLPFSLYRDFSGAMLVISIASLMRSGVSLRSSIERAIRFSTPWMRWHLREILRGITAEHGSQFGLAFATGVLNPAMEDRVQDAAERRDPVTAFVKVGVGSIDRIERTMEASSSRINALMLAVAACVLGVMMLGFFQTSFEMQSGVQAAAATGARR